MKQTLTAAVGAMALLSMVSTSTAGLRDTNTNAPTHLKLADRLQVTQTDEPIVTGPNLPSAGELTVNTDCDRVKAGLPLTAFRWSAPDDLNGRQRIEITPYRTGFESKNYRAIGELKSTQREMAWDGGEPGVNYYWRVLTRTPNGWVASEVARYEAPTCPVDFERATDAPN